MFRNRNNSQKPSDELLANWKASFPGRIPTARHGSLTEEAEAPPQSLTSLTDALDVAVSTRHHAEDNEINDLGPTRCANAEQWCLTPFILDPNGFAFSNFANQPPGYFRTPAFAKGLGKPLSMPIFDGSLQVGHISASTSTMGGSNPQALAPHEVFHRPNLFAFHHQQPAGLQYHEEQKIVDSGVDVEIQEQSPVGPFIQSSLDVQVRQVPPPLLAENFHYNLTLNAPTAMVKYPEEIPVTYLNRGQVYSISIVDTKPTPLGDAIPRYRTFIRISFEDEQQRQQPAQSWQLWKRGQGIKEAHNRCGRVQPVEFVDTNQTDGVDQGNRPRIELESASFDGFSVTWSPVHSGLMECAVGVRFNFLSTDFSYSKGIKGVPVRLCAKTQLLSGEGLLSPIVTSNEVCYCKVKIFRGHGAERKLSNDVTHVKKSIDRLKQRALYIESGMKELGKRKRSESGSKPGPGKFPKQKRTWSISLAGDTGNRGSQEDVLQIKLTALENMFTSTRPASVLFLRGEELDDPDLHPVHLSGEPTDLTKLETRDTAMEDKASTNLLSIVSLTLSQQSLHSNNIQGSFSGLQRPTTFQPHSRLNSSDWQNLGQITAIDLPGSTQPFAASDNPIKVSKAGQEGSTHVEWIEALGVDFMYQPRFERVFKPVACVYIQPRVAGKQPGDNYFRAVYLMQKTVKDLINGIAIKSGVKPSKVLRILRITQQGLKILLDDETVVQLPEGQDMVAEFSEIRSLLPIMKREWDSGQTDAQADDELDLAQAVLAEGYELRLLY